MHRNGIGMTLQPDRVGDAGQTFRDALQASAGLRKHVIPTRWEESLLLQRDHKSAAIQRHANLTLLNFFCESNLQIAVGLL